MSSDQYRRPHIEVTTVYRPMKKSAQIGSSVDGIATSNLLMTDCSRNFPEQPLEDCKVHKGSASTFPAGDKALCDARIARCRFLRKAFVAATTSLKDLMCQQARKWDIRICPLCH